jgi:hypothetical protein
MFTRVLFTLFNARLGLDLQLVEIVSHVVAVESPNGSGLGRGEPSGF